MVLKFLLRGYCFVLKNNTFPQKLFGLHTYITQTLQVFLFEKKLIKVNIGLKAQSEALCSCFDFYVVQNLRTKQKQQIN